MALVSGYSSDEDDDIMAETSVPALSTSIIAGPPRTLEAAPEVSLEVKAAPRQPNRK
jgi:hypothetical protein